MKRLAAIAAIAALIALAAGPGYAASTGPGTDTAVAAATDGKPHVTLLEQPAWTTLGDDVAFRLALTGPIGNLEARAIVHSSLISRTGFERTVQGERLGSTIATTDAPAAALPAAPGGGRVLTLKLQSPTLPRDTSRLRLALPRSSSTGVFPVEIELRDPDTLERVSSFVTHLVAVSPSAAGAPVGAPLNVAWIWKVAADPATEPGGAVQPTFVKDVAPGGRLTRLATSAARAGAVPLTLAPGPETMESWTVRAKADPQSAPGLTNMRASARTKQILSGPYVPIDVPSLERAGLGNDASLQLAQGSVALGTAVGTRPDSRTTDISPLDSKALTRLELSQVDRLVVSPSQLAAPDAPPQFTPARPFRLANGDRQFATVQTDDGLERLVDGEGTPALQAANFMAGLAIVAIEQPNEKRGVAIEMPRLWDPRPALVNAVVKGLTGNPLLTPVTLDQLFDGVPFATDKGSPVVRELAPLVPPAPTVSASHYRSTRADLNAFASTVGADDPRILAGNRALLVSLTSVWPGAAGREQSAARLDGITRGISEFAGLIETPPSGLTVTLTSRQADLPLSFNNQTGQTVRLQIKFDSDKLEFPDGDQRELILAPQNNTKSFRVVTRASGTFPLHISVTTADGQLPLRAARYTVRSTVVSGVGVFLTIGAGLFLAIWWITHWRRSRRRPIRPATLAT